MGSTKKFSFSDLVFFGISSIVGAGAFLSTAKAYQQGSYHVIWIVLIGAVIAGVLALCFAEMGGRFQKTGGVYLYAKESFGKGFAFNIGLIRFVVIALALATEGVAIPSLLADLWPVFNNQEIMVIIGALFLILLFIINSRGVSSSALSAKIIEIIVLGTIFTFIITGFFFIKGENFISTLPVDETGNPGSLTFGIFSKTLILLFYAFLGFENIGTGAQDMENPTKNIPRAIIVTIAILAVMYFFVYLNLVGVLGPNLLGVNNGIGAAAASYMGKWAEVFVTVVCIIAIIGIGLSQMFAGARSLSPMAEDHFFPENLAALNHRGVPMKSLVIIACLAFLLIVLGTYLSKDVFILLVACTTIGRILQYITVSIGILVLRKKAGKSEGYSLRFAPVLVTLAVLICIALIFTANLHAFIGLFSLIVITALIYFFYSKPRERKSQAQ